jgi:subtilisin family serine protease
MNKKTDTKDFIKINEIKNKKIIDVLTKTSIYSPEEYGISAQYTGEGVKILIIDSGCPEHKDIDVLGEKQDFISNENKPNDETGHGTIMAGIISAKNKKTIIGIAPKAEIFYAKATDKYGNGNYNSIVASVL